MTPERLKDLITYFKQVPIVKQEYAMECITEIQRLQAALPTPAKGEAMTTNTQHTPGPWKIVEMNDPIYGRNLEISSEIGYVAEVDLIPGGTQGRAKHEANARLIAAAPELLEALKKAEEVLTIARGITKEDYGIYDRIIAKGHAHEMNLIRAAIAKAEGR